MIGERKRRGGWVNPQVLSPCLFLAIYVWAELSWASLKKQMRKNQNENLFLIFLFFFFQLLFFREKFWVSWVAFEWLVFLFCFFVFNFFRLLVVVIKENDNDVVVDILQNDDVSMLLCLSWLIHSYPFTTFIHSNSSYIYNEKRVVYNFIGFSFFIFNTT